MRWIKTSFFFERGYKGFRFKLRNLRLLHGLRESLFDLGDDPKLFSAVWEIALRALEIIPQDGAAVEGYEYDIPSRTLCIWVTSPSFPETGPLELGTIEDVELSEDRLQVLRAALETTIAVRDSPEFTGE